MRASGETDGWHLKGCWEASFAPESVSGVDVRRGGELIDPPLQGLALQGADAK